MPNLSRTIAAAVNTTVNPVIGWLYETIPFRMADVWVAVAKVAGTDLVTINLATGTNQIAQGDQVPIAASLIWPDHFIWSDRLKFGEKIQLDIVQGAVSANPIQVAIRMTAVG